MRKATTMARVEMDYSSDEPTSYVSKCGRIHLKFYWKLTRKWRNLSGFKNMVRLYFNQSEQTRWIFNQSEAQLKSIVTWRTSVFPRLAPVTCFPALCTGWMFSRDLHWLNVFPRLAPAARFDSSSDWFSVLLAFVDWPDKQLESHLNCFFHFRLCVRINVIT